MENTGAAAAVGGSSVGLKGIIAGKYYRNSKASSGLIVRREEIAAKLVGSVIYF
jgi:hypothetical protein